MTLFLVALLAIVRVGVFASESGSCALPQFSVDACTVALAIGSGRGFHRTIEASPACASPLSHPLAWNATLPTGAYIDVHELERMSYSLARPESPVDVESLHAQRGAKAW